ncbi:MAG: TIGR02253 family HAD-type hydrolase [Ignavibacteriales bacterium]|nr:TIGR02253 family HAD-type hydrolase [Ignavibacteriales bacterium]
MIKAIVFDLDNTLVDFMKMKERAVEAAVKAMIDAGLEIEHSDAIAKINQIYKEQGIEYQKVFDLFLQKHFNNVSLKIMSAGIVAYRKAREAELIPYAHVYPTLIHLTKMGLKLGILSDAPAREAWLRLAYLNLHHIFDEVVTFEDTNERKPNPAPFLAILKKLGCNAYETLMVGDWAERDIVGAKNLGMKTAFARYGDTFDTKEHSADFELKDIKNIIQVINDINTLE